MEKNLEKLREVIESYRGDLYVFPEMFLVGYTIQDLFYRLAKKPGSEALNEIVKMSRDRSCGIIVGFPEKSELGFLYNSALIAFNGSATVYRKRHLPTFSIFDEHRWFRPFRGELKPFDMGIARVGVAICYDMFFPEIFKAYALRGAQIMIVISASPDTSVPLFHALARARAIETTSYVVWVNNAGVLDGITFGGGSLVVAPLGDVVLELRRGEEDVRVIDLDLAEVDRARRVRPVIRDSDYFDALQLLEAYRDLEGVHGIKAREA